MNGFLKAPLRLISAGLLAAGAVAGAATGASAADVTLTFWNIWDGSRAPQLRSVLDKFEQQNPGIKVENVTLTNVTTAQRMLAALASGDVPDLYMTTGNDLSQWGDLGAFMPLDDMVKKDGLDVDTYFFPSTVEGSKYKDRLLQFPYRASSSFAIWYNKDLFKAAGLDPDKPPKTWQELEAAGEKLMKKSGDLLTQLGLNDCMECGGASVAFNDWLSRNNGHLFSADGTKVAFDSPEGLATLKWMVDFSNRTAGGWDSAVKAFGSNFKDLRPAFYAGKVAMIMDGPYLVNILKNDAPQMVDKVGVFLLPLNGDNPNARQVYDSYGVGGYAIPRGAKHPEESFKLLKFLTMSDDGACTFFTLQNRPDSPMRTCRAGLDSPLADVLIANKNATRAAVQPPTYPKAFKRLQDMQVNALLGKQTPEEAIKAAAVDVQRILDAGP